MATNDIKRDDMVKEAVERLELLEVMESDIENFILENEITKIYVNHEKRKLTKDEITEEERNIIQRIEKEKDVIVYYIIQDEGMWPDGGIFSRYTFLHVDKYSGDYDMVKEDCIKGFGTVSAYVVNMEEPEYLELAEIAFRNIEGMLINAS